MGPTALSMQKAGRPLVKGGMPCPSSTTAGMSATSSSNAHWPLVGEADPTAVEWIAHHRRFYLTLFPGSDARAKGATVTTRHFETFDQARAEALPHTSCAWEIRPSGQRAHCAGARYLTPRSPSCRLRASTNHVLTPRTTSPSSIPPRCIHGRRTRSGGWASRVLPP